MAGTRDTAGIEVFTSTGEDLNPDTSSYLITGERRAAIVDPGPDWHVENHLGALESAIDPDGWLYVVILSPLPGCLSGLRLLTRLTGKRAVMLHWTVAAGAGNLLSEWTTRSPDEKGGLLPIGAAHQVLLVPPTGTCVPGALVGYDRNTHTLFSGPFFGSLGHGRITDRPVLRRESVRAYTDLFTPGIGPQIVDDAFEAKLPITRIAPAHGKLAVGGRNLIQAVFELDRQRPTVPWAFHRLYLRIAGLLGEEAAAGVYRASGLPSPDLEKGFAPPVTFDDVVAKWMALHERSEQWLSGVALSAVRLEIARMSIDVGLPVPSALRAIARAFSATPTRVNEPDVAPEAPPAPPPEARDELTDELTDEVTGLLNETVFNERLASLFEEPTKVVTSLLLIGVDNIERINTRHGRSGGDDALHTVAYLLRNHRFAQDSRGGHRVYKLNGPQFAFVLGGTSLAGASTAAEELRQSVAESAMFLEQITVSIGVVSSDETEPNQGSPTDRLIQSAQSRLRVARSSGMNTVCATDPEGVSSLGGGATVLIADSDAPYLDVLTRQLTERGYTVLVAEDGEDALDIISQIAPDIIVCEVMLPKTNGFAVRERLRHSSRLSEIPFILISHRKNDEMIEKASLLGIVHFLRKPLSLVELTGLLRNLSEGPPS